MNGPLTVIKVLPLKQNSEIFVSRERNNSLAKRKWPETGKHAICQQQTAV